MSIPIGNLVIEMAINQARMIKDIEAAKKSIDSSMAGIKKAAETATKALGLVGVALSAAAFAGWIKGAIQVADEANKMAQKVGIATKDVAGLQLAFKQGGVDADGMQKALSKLSVGVLDGNAALKAMGIESRNADGSLKTTREVVGLVADQFATYEDGIAKTKLAIELFGKSGADLIPILNAGGASLDEYDSMAKKLGLTLTDETAASAEKFNDTMELIGMGSKGVATQIAAELLPTLENLSAQFLEFMTQGDGIRITADIIATGLKGIATVAVGTHYALKDLGNVLGSLYEQGVALGSLDFAAIDKIRAQRETDAAKNAADLNDAYDRIWKKSGDASVEAMAKMVGAAKRAAPEIGALADQAKAAADAYAKMIKQADDLVASILFETKALTMNSTEKETAIALQKLANMGIKEGTKEYEKYSEAIIAATLDKAQVQSIIDSNKRIEEARLDAIKKADEAQKKMEEDAAKQISDIGNQVGQSFADALMSGGKNAADYLKDLFRTLILRPIVQPLISGTISGILAGAAGSASASGLSGGIGGSGGLMGSVSTLKNMYDMATGSFASLGTSVSGMAESLGANLILANEAGSTLSVAGQSLVSSAASLGTAASYLGGVGAGLGLGNMISGDKSVGGSSWITTGAGTAIGAVVGGPLGSAIGGAIGGAINAAFGMGKKENTDSGILGNLTSSGVGLANYQEWEQKGGWLRSGDSGADWTPADSKVTKYMNDVVAKTAITVKQYADVLGLPAKGIAEFSFEIKQSLVGLTAEEAQKQIDFLLAAYGNALASNVASEIGPFQRDGEEAGATLARLATSLQSVNSVFDTLNITLMETSLSGADASSKLVDMFGGIDKFVSATDAYYQAFYTEQERAAKTTEQLTAVFSQLGLSMPATNDAFRAMVESARAAGNDGLFASLIKLAPAFKDLQTSLANITDYSSQLNTALSNVKSALSAEQDATLAIIDGQKVAAQSWKDSATSSVSALTSVFDYLAGQVNDLLGLVDTAQSAAQGASFVRDALLNANATGNLPDQNSLSKAVSAARSGLVSSNFGSSTEMRIAQARLAADLSGLLEVAGDQKTTAEIQVELAQEQLDALDAQANDVKNYYAAQLAYAQAQVDQLSGINGGVLSVGDAMAALAGVVNTARQAQAQAHPASVSQSAISMQAQIEGLYNSILGRGSDPIGLANWMQAAANGKSIDQIRQEFLNSAEYQSMPHFASGGAYPGGLAMVGERGPELINFGAPGQIYSSAQTSSILSGEQVASELRAMREEQAAQARSTAAINLRMTRIIERWEGSGMPETRVTT